MDAMNGYESNFDSANFSVVAAVAGGSAASSCGNDLDAAVLEMPIYFQKEKNFNTGCDALNCGFFSGPA